jgi:O-acetyl-ADP-ribose deacetylase (regulator of RNase III)
MAIEVLHDDITRVRVDAIVNAANARMLGGGGVDGAIHRAAGPALLQECLKVKEVSPGVRCPTGEARITPASGSIQARFIIHTVGPIWEGGDANEDELLARCYHNSLKLAAENDAASIAFPAISTGVYRFPAERAVGIAVREVKTFLQSFNRPEKVVFVCFSPDIMAMYQRELK